MQKGQNVSTRPSAARQLSDDSSDSGDSSGMTADQWFEHSNKRPGVGVQSSFHDGTFNHIRRHIGVLPYTPLLTIPS